MSFDPERQRIGLLFYRCYLKSRRAIDKRIRPLHINLRHVWLMSLAQEHRYSQQEMSRLLDLNENVMVRLVDYLEELKYVRRE